MKLKVDCFFLLCLKISRWIDRSGKALAKGMLVMSSKIYTCSNR